MVLIFEFYICAFLVSEMLELFLLEVLVFHFWILLENPILVSSVML